MKTNLKKLTALLVAVAMMFALAACGGKKGDDVVEETEYAEEELVDADGNPVSDNSGSTSDGKSSGKSDTTTKVYVADDNQGAKLQPIGNPYGSIPSNVKGTTVKFATWIDHTSNESTQVLKDFTAKTGIKVELVKVPQVGYMSKMTSMIASGQAPDVFVDNYEFPVSLKIAQPVNSYVNLKDPVWSKAHISYSTFNGKTYIVNGENVHWNFVNGIIYHKKTAEDNGITTPDDYLAEGKWNWSNLRQFMKDYSSIPGDYYGGLLKPEELAASAGTGLVKYNNGKFSSGIGDSQLTEAIKKVADINKNGYSMDSTLQKFFCDGTQALTLGSNWQFTKSAIAWETLKPGSMGFVPLPAPDKGEAYAPQNTRGYGICKGSKNPEGAGYFLRYFLDAANYDNNVVYKDASVTVPMIEKVRSENAKRKKCLVVSENCMNLVNSTLYNNIATELKGTDPSQIASVLSKKSGVCKNAADKANDLVNKAK
ncbi:MAG: extracellular solute-binding protein [Clostridia bacterium]|nr:extracellular solute-binding protein [Clostridia bacterium]